MAKKDTKKKLIIGTAAAAAGGAAAMANPRVRRGLSKMSDKAKDIKEDIQGKL